MASFPSPEVRTMDASLLDLYKRGVISDRVALEYAQDPELLQKRMNLK